MRMKLHGVLRDDHGCVPVTILVTGPISNNTYILFQGAGEQRKALVVDPSGRADDIIAQLDGAPVTDIVCTHNHSDHVMGLPELVQKTGARVVASQVDAPVIEAGQDDGVWGVVPPVPVDVKIPPEGGTYSFGDLTFTAIMTPGHTPGGMCLYLPAANGKPGMLFSGDTLFAGATGRTDFEGGDERAMRASLRDKLAPLPDDTVVYPGHDALTTIGAERQRTIMAY
jgi:hydroxyacylglutathione hydrolase